MLPHLKEDNVRKAHFYGYMVQKLLKVKLGYLEYDKLMHPNKYKSSYIELADWLQNYPDFPVVMQRRVYKLMMRRKSQENKKETLQLIKDSNETYKKNLS